MKRLLMEGGMRRFVWLGMVACLLAMPARAEEGPGLITTQATARTRLVNTVADVSLGIDAEARTVASVQEMMGQRSQRLLAYLRGQGVERLRTGSLSVTPETEPVKGQPDRITGYSGRLRVSFRVPAERLGAVVGEALGQGGNALDGTSLSPRETEVDAAKRALAAEAVRTALAQARAVAEAAGLQLADVRRIAVDPSGAPRYPVNPAPVMAMARAARPAPPIETEAGDTEIEATVSVTVALNPVNAAPAAR